MVAIGRLLLHAVILLSQAATFKHHANQTSEVEQGTHLRDKVAMVVAMGM